MAIFVSSLAAVEALWETDENAVKNCVATAGFSIGELTALVFSGMLSFDDGIRLVHARGKAMQEASELTPSGMMTVLYPGRDANLGLACEAAKKWIKEKHEIPFPVCNIANHLYAGAKVIAGHSEALNFIEANKKDFRIRKCIRLPVSGAFHTDLMIPAQGLFEEIMKNVNFTDPRIPVLSNFHSRPYDARNAKKLLSKQMINSVKWEQLINNLFKYKEKEFYPRIIECGPGNSLSAMMKNINGKMAKNASYVPA